MQQSFEYLKVQTAMDSVTVENVGNVILSATNDIGLEWILFIETNTGRSTIKEFGPLFRENQISKFGFQFNIENKEYNEKYLCKKISTFLNVPNREITQVQEIDEFDFQDKISQAKEIL